MAAKQICDINPDEYYYAPKAADKESGQILCREECWWQASDYLQLKFDALITRWRKDANSKQSDPKLQCIFTFDKVYRNAEDQWTQDADSDGKQLQLDLYKKLKQLELKFRLEVFKQCKALTKTQKKDVEGVIDFCTPVVDEGDAEHPTAHPSFKVNVSIYKIDKNYVPSEEGPWEPHYKVKCNVVNPDGNPSNKSLAQAGKQNARVLPLFKPSYYSIAGMKVFSVLLMSAVLIQPVNDIIAFLPTEAVLAGKAAYEQKMLDDAQAKQDQEDAAALDAFDAPDEEMRSIAAVVVKPEEPVIKQEPAPIVTTVVPAAVVTTAVAEQDPYADDE